MANYREILTKAIIAKGNSKIEEYQKINVEEIISRALGCWIINHQSTIEVENNKVYVNGSYEAHIWYGFENDTKSKLASQIFNFKNEITYFFNDKSNTELSNENEIKKYVTKQPTCIELKYEDKTLTMKIVRNYAIDIVGETKLTIKVSDDEVDELSSINTNYITDKK